MTRRTSQQRHSFPLLFLGGITLALVILLPLRLGALRGTLIFNDSSSSLSSSSIPGIVACGPNDDLFPAKDDDPEGKQWDTDFDTTVSAVIEADKDTSLLSCTNDARVMASSALKNLAEKLPQWQDLERPLYESDLPQVLTDYLEAYGCALEYASHSIYYDLQHNGSSSSTPASYYDAAVNTIQWFKDKDLRLANAEKTVRRSVALAVSMGRFKPLEHSFLCIARASRDIRNLFGLGAEGSACIPVRTWDAKGFLRDLSDQGGN